MPDIFLSLGDTVESKSEFLSLWSCIQVGDTGNKHVISRKKQSEKTEGDWEKLLHMWSLGKVSLNFKLDFNLELKR